MEHSIRKAALSPTFLIGIAFILFQVWILFEPQQPLFERPIHLCAALILLFLCKPLSIPSMPVWISRSIDAALVLATLLVASYYLTGFERLTTRMENVSPIFPVDIAAGG